MALIIISEFAKDHPSDDIKVLYHTNTILDEPTIQNHVASIFMALYSSGGNHNDEPRDGTIPLGAKFAYAFSTVAPDCIRLSSIVVPSNEQEMLKKLVISDDFKALLKPLNELLRKEEVPVEKIEGLVHRILAKIDENDDATRISNVFSEEI